MFSYFSYNIISFQLGDADFDVPGWDDIKGANADVCLFLYHIYRTYNKYDIYFMLYRLIL